MFYVVRSSVATGPSSVDGSVQGSADPQSQLESTTREIRAYPINEFCGGVEVRGEGEGHLFTGNCM